MIRTVLSFARPAMRSAPNAICRKSSTTAGHHHHETGSTGAQCANCHMPSKTYMVIDVRRDHAIRIPRPDLSVAIGTPNACNQCHTERSPEWAAAADRRLVWSRTAQ